MLIMTKIGPDGAGVRRVLQAVLGLCGLAVLAGCTTTPVTNGINDPAEAQNRAIHQFNKEMDTLVLRPAGTAYVTYIPQPVAIGVSNFADNLSLPGAVVNDLLQFKIDSAAQNTGRFVLNSTVGLLGILDPASSMGLLKQPNDFGETLAFYGMPEGAYVELPLLGPSNDRDMIGSVVDVFLDPSWLFVPLPLIYLSYGASVGTTVGDRGRYSATVDSILYDSADGYAQARLLYLQNRRFQLGQPAMTDTFEDPYAE